jgi:hypothetical protein
MPEVYANRIYRRKAALPAAQVTRMPFGLPSVRQPPEPRVVGDADRVALDHHVEAGVPLVAAGGQRCCHPRGYQASTVVGFPWSGGAGCAIAPATLLRNCDIYCKASS